MGAADKFEILGPISNVGEFLSTLDVFGYPLCRDHYGTGEQVLIEAMAVGVPQVVLQRDSKEYVVENGVTGLVADTLDDYCRCLDRLQNDDDLRRSLSKNSFERARLRFGIENTIASFDSIYEELMELPKRRREFAGAEGRLTPDRVFTLSQGPEAEKVYRLLDGCGAEADVSRLPALSWSQTRGSVFHYSHFCPENARLSRLKGLMAALRPPRSAFQYN